MMPILAKHNSELSDTQKGEFRQKILGVLSWSALNDSSVTTQGQQEALKHVELLFKELQSDRERKSG